MLLSIESIIEGFLPIGSMIESGYTFVKGLGVIEQTIGMLVFGIIGILGTFSLIKKLSKIIIIVIVLGGLYYLYDSGMLSGLLGG